MDVDTGAVRRLAEELTERANEIRAEAARLARRIADVPWEGRAADAMRLQAGLRLAALSHTADLHDDAAEALVRHAGAVDTALGFLDDVVDLADDLADNLVDHTIGLVL